SARASPRSRRGSAFARDASPVVLATAAAHAATRRANRWLAVVLHHIGPWSPCKSQARAARCPGDIPDLAVVRRRARLRGALGGGSRRVPRLPSAAPSRDQDR